MHERIKETLLVLEDAAARTPQLACIRPLSWLYHTTLEMEQAGLLEKMTPSRMADIFSMAGKIVNAAEAEEFDPALPGLLRRFLNLLIFPPADTRTISDSNDMRITVTIAANKLRMVRPFPDIMEEIWRISPAQISEEEKDTWKVQMQVMKEQLDGYLGIRRSFLLEEQIRRRKQSLRWLEKMREELPESDTVLADEEELRIRKEELRKQKEETDEYYSKTAFYAETEGTERTRPSDDTVSAEYAGDRKRKQKSTVFDR